MSLQEQPKKAPWMIWLLRPNAWVIGLNRIIIGGMILVAILGLGQGKYSLVAICLLGIGCALAPGWLRRRYLLEWPSILEFLIVFQLALHTLGVWLRLYDTHWFWDKILHVQGTMLVSFVGFLWLYALHATRRLRLSGPLLGLFTLLIGNAVGAWWEIAEFVVDKTLGKNTQYSLDNTMWDIINNMIGSLLAAGLAWFYAHHADGAQQRRLAEPLARSLGTLLLDHPKHNAPKPES